MFIEKLFKKKKSQPIEKVEANKEIKYICENIGDVLSAPSTKELNERLSVYLTERNCECPWGDWGDSNKFSDWMSNKNNSLTFD